MVSFGLMKEAGIFSQEFSRNPKKWLVLGGLAVFRSLCELAFLGLLRDKAAQLLGQPSHLQLDSLLAAFLLLLVLAMRFIAQKAYLRSSLRMQGDFRENKENKVLMIPSFGDAKFNQARFDTSQRSDRTLKNKMHQFELKVDKKLDHQQFLLDLLFDELDLKKY